MTLRDPARNTVVSLTGLSAMVAINHIVFETNSRHFVNYNPLFGILAVLLLCITFLGIGYFATRFPVLQSAFVFFLGSLIVTVVDYAPAIYPDTHYFPLPVLLKIMRVQLVYVAIACVLGYVGAWIRSRVNKRPQRARDATRVKFECI